MNIFNLGKTDVEKTASVLIGVVVLAFVGAMMFVGSVTVELGKESVVFDATFVGNAEIKYDEIENVELTSNFNRGTRTFGIGSARLSAGNFRNDLLGDYLLYSFNSSDKCIIVTCSDKTVVFNSKTDEQTEDMFDTLNEKLK